MRACPWRRDRSPDGGLDDRQEATTQVQLPVEVGDLVDLGGGDVLAPAPLDQSRDIGGPDVDGTGILYWGVCDTVLLIPLIQVQSSLGAVSSDGKGTGDSTGLCLLGEVHEPLGPLGLGAGGDEPSCFIEDVGPVSRVTTLDLAVR